MSMAGVTLDELRARDRRLDRRLSRQGASAADLAVMIRTGLVAADCASLALSDTPFEHWHSGAWASYGLVRGATSLRPTVWKPDWLDHYDATAPDDAPSRRRPRRFDDDVPADLFYRQTMGHA